MQATKQSKKNTKPARVVQRTIVPRIEPNDAGGDNNWVWEGCRGLESNEVLGKCIAFVNKFALSRELLDQHVTSIFSKANRPWWDFPSPSYDEKAIIVYLKEEGPDDVCDDFPTIEGPLMLGGVYPSLIAFIQYELLLTAFFSRWLALDHIDIYLTWRM